MGSSIVVTGSSGGFGSAVTAALVSSGHSVLGLDQKPPISKLNGLTHLTVDLSDTGEITSALASRTQPVGAVIHCAAEQPLAEAGGGAGAEIWSRAYAVNVLALEHIVSELKSDLAATEPRRVIAIGSIHDKATSRNIAPYAVSKGALAAWVRSAALDLGRHGIAAIGVSAGAIESPKLREGLMRFPDPEEAWQRLVDRLPVGRVVAPEDLAALCLFLLRPEAVHFTGSSLSFDGGVSSVLASE